MNPSGLVLRRPCAFLASLVSLLALGVRVAQAVTSAGHVCEIEPTRSAIEDADRARAVVGQKRFDPSWRTDHATGEKVYVGNALLTDSKGRITVWRADDRKAGGTGIAIRGRRIEVATESAVEIKEVRERGRTVEFVRLARGEVAIHCLGCGAETPNARVTDTQSHFVMRYAKDTVAVTEVVTVRGAVRVRNAAGGRAVTVRAGQRTLVVAGEPPTDPTDLGRAEIEGYLRPFELVGGGIEQSQLVDNRNIRDLALPADDPAVRPPTSSGDGATVVGGPVVDTGGRPGTLYPPPATPPIDRAGEPGGLFQPGTPALFGGPRLGIEF
jgi:hypothetical protein